jgi:peptidoglycan/LPS O-acetylase OafA/YrhL
LDHVRAIAALMVFTWHFAGQLRFPHNLAAPGLAIFEQGYTGVSLFMVLSGYLFAKLLDRKEVHYRAFFWNRFIRLFPLLAVVLVLAGLQECLLHHASAAAYLENVLRGAIFPTLPNGGWSITVECHFYLLLPLLMAATRRWVWAPLAFMSVALAARYALYLQIGEIQSLAYWTIVGHVDQFLVGILAFNFRGYLRKNHFLAISTAVAFVAFYYWFDRAGGWTSFGGPYPSPSALWVFIPTIEAVAYGLLVAYYDSSFSFRNAGISRVVGAAGAYSYSIYLLHFFFVFRASHFVDDHVIRLSNFYLAAAASLVCFCGMIPIGWASFRFIESPFLRLRVPYVRPQR